MISIKGRPNMKNEYISKPESSWAKHKKVLLLLLIASCIISCLAFTNAAAASTEANANGDKPNGADLSKITDVFAPLVGISGSPLVALSFLSGAGSLLNSGKINFDRIPFAETLANLPIAHTGVFICMLLFALAKVILSTSSLSKVFSDATLGRLESIIGTACTVGGPLLMASTTSVIAAEVATLSIGGGATPVVLPMALSAAPTATVQVMEFSGAGMEGFLLTSAISFLASALAYIVYVVMKTAVKAVDVLAFLFSPRPGMTALFNTAKTIIVSAYTWIALTNPRVASIVGLIFLAIATLVFRKARRLELYYRRLYVVPFSRALFRRKAAIPLMPKRLPYGASKNFHSVDICVEGFFANKASRLYKRERCYFIRSEGKNHIFKKRLFGKTIKIEITGDVYIEKSYVIKKRKKGLALLKIFTDEALDKKSRRIYFFMRRDHQSNIAELIDRAGLIDYSLILDERERLKAEERALKAQQLKGAVKNKLLRRN